MQSIFGALEKTTVLLNTWFLKATGCLDITNLVVYKAMVLLKLCSFLEFLVTLTHDLFFKTPRFCISLAYNITIFEKYIQTRPYLDVVVLRNCSINYQQTLILEQDMRQTLFREMWSF